jgi:hypothetical protein
MHPPFSQSCADDVGGPDAGEVLRRCAAKTGIPSIRVYDDMDQCVEIRKGIEDRGFRD